MTLSSLSIHHLSATELDPASFVHAAAEAGFKRISAFTCGDPKVFPLLNDNNVIAFQKALRDTGLQLANVDAFMLLPNTRWSTLIPAMERGAEFGALGISMQLFDHDRARCIDLISQISEHCLSLGLKPAIEFMPLTPHWKTLRETVALLSEIAMPHLGIGIDILHLLRAGETPDVIKGIDPSLIHYAQLCDGTHLKPTNDYGVEAASDRLLPGHGVFPIAEFIQALPPGTPLELEVPQRSNEAAKSRIRKAFLACQGGF